jgi:hypothetical protein
LERGWGEVKGSTDKNHPSTSTWYIHLKKNLQMDSDLLNLINLVQKQFLLLPGVTSVGFCNENKLLTLEASETINTLKVETLIFKAGYRMKIESITPKIQTSTGNQLKSFVQLNIRLFSMFPIMPFSRS